jgi:hypothetical protein
MLDLLLGLKPAYTKEGAMVAASSRAFGCKKRIVEYAQKEREVSRWHGFPQVMV